jgi:4-hydroxybenzoate polyprenyltransferase
VSPLPNLIYGVLLIPLALVAVLPTNPFAAIAFCIGGVYLIAYAYRDLKKKLSK